METAYARAGRGGDSASLGFTQGYLPLAAMTQPPRVQSLDSRESDDLRTVSDGPNRGSSGARQSQRPKRIACRDCRQAKLRCEGLRNGVGPCTRCRRLSLSCQIDTSYKRINKRAKINELFDELEQLRSMVGQKPGSNHQQDASQSSPSGHEQQSPAHLASPLSLISNVQAAVNERSDHSPNRVDAVCSQSDEIWQRTNTQFEPQLGNHNASFTPSTARSLEHIELEGMQISELFQIFFKHHHHFLEILDPSVSPDSYYSRSPALFWAIISVAARRYEDDATLLGNLNPCVSKLIWSNAGLVPLSSYTIQALLLLANWSFPCDSQWKDPSLLLVSVAKSAAMQNGLHRPETVQDFRRVKTKLSEEEFQDAIKLWVGCFITAESVTTTAGQPSLFSSSWAIDRACEEGNDYSVPDNLRYYLLIQKFIRRVNTTMAKENRSPIGQGNERDGDGLMKLLECDFDDLEQRFGDNATEIHRLALVMGSLQLRTYYLLETSLSENRKQGLLRAYSTALNYISRVAKEDSRTDFIRYAPNIFSVMLTHAGMLVMKLVNSSYARYLEVDEGKRSFNVVLGLLRKASLENNDIRGRASKIMAQLWSVHRSRTLRREQEPSLNVRSRLGASVLHDELWTWREEFGGQGVASSKDAQPQIPSQEQIQTTTSIPAISPPSIEHQSNADSESTGDEMRNRINNVSQLQQQFDQSYSGDQNNFYSTNLTEDIANMDWTWDIGSQSLLSIDIDSYKLMPGAF